MNTRFNILIISFLLINSGYSQSCSPGALEVRSIKAFATDNQIDWELQNHQVFVNNDCPSNDKLLVHLVGTYDAPSSTTYFPIQGTQQGYKVICLKYPNGVSGTSACKASSDIDCHWKYHQEIIYGDDTSPDVNVDGNNCIVNRLEKLIIYLKNQHPGENWDAFLTGSNTIDWSNIAVSGHSQGGGHAAFIAKYSDLNRVILFASPNEYSSYFSAPASWINLSSATAESDIYSFGNYYDDVVDFSEQYQVWNTMNLGNYGDTVNIDIETCPYSNSHMLYTKYNSGAGLAAHHNSVVIDNYTPINASAPIFLNVWDYLLGDCVSTSSIDEDMNSKLMLHPNPANSELKIKGINSISSIAITDIHGKQQSFTQDNNTIQIGHLSSGVYYISVESPEGTHKERFVKE